MDGPEVKTALVDVRNASFDQVWRDFDALQGAVDDLLRQVERQRFNIGGSAPPGRAD